MPAYSDGGWMSELLENLKAFNRRERFFVVGWALDNPHFTVGDEFRAHLARDTGIQIPADAFCAMDFPLDWIKGCLWLTKVSKQPFQRSGNGRRERKK
jgi:hypothetical protein